MRINGKGLYTFSKVLVLFAMMYSMVYGMTFRVHLIIRQNRANYRVEKFVVSEVYWESDGEGISYFVKGTVAGRDEDLYHPVLSDGSRPRRKRDLVAAFPRGAEVDVIYNPDVPVMDVNGESPRLMQAGMDYFDREPTRLLTAAAQTFIPVTLTIAFALYMRYQNRRKQRAISAADS